VIKRAWGKRRAIVVAPPGWGKTRTVLALYYFYKKTNHVQKCLVLAHTKGWSGYPKDNLFGFKMKVFKELTDIAYLVAHPKEVFEVYDIAVVVTSQLDEFHAGLFPNEKAQTQRVVLRPEQAFSRVAAHVDLVLMDEVHRYRTDVAKVNHTLAQFFRAYPRNKLAVYITATLFYTSALDTFQIMQYVDPQIFPNYWAFYEEFVDYQWKKLRQKKLINNRLVWVVNEVREKLGNKNMGRLRQILEPFLVETVDKRWTFHWKMRPYVLTDTENATYTSFVQGLGLEDKLLRFTLFSHAGGKPKSLTAAQKELVELYDTSMVEASEIHVGWMVKLKGQNIPWIVKKVEEIDDEAAITKRLPALQKFLSTTADKLDILRQILEKDGCLVYCQYHETANNLGEWAKKLWPHRKVSVLTGATTKVHSKILGHDRSEIMFCTRAITESLNFYFRQVAIYESITNPGMLEQYLGRNTRSDADYSDLDVYVLLGKETIDAYFWERLLLNINSLDGNTFQGVLPHSPDWEWIKDYVIGGKVTFPVLKKLLLWRGTMGMVEDLEGDDGWSREGF